MTARREDRLKEIQEDLEKKFNSKVFIYPLDIANFEQCEAFFGSIPEEFKNVDILVNNAGLALERNTTWESEWDHIETMINVNVKGVLKMIKLFVPGMIERKVGHIITVGSIAGKQSYPGGSIYCGTKHMIEGVNTALRFELVGTPLRVSLVCPGLVETEFSMTRFQGDETKAKSVYEGCQPLTGADIADNIVYIASRYVQYFAPVFPNISFLDPHTYK